MSKDALQGTDNACVPAPLTRLALKAQFKPSELTCPEEYTWHDFAAVRSLIERNKYARLHPGPKTMRTAVETDAIVSRIPLVLRGDVIYLNVRLRLTRSLSMAHYRVVRSSQRAASGS